MTAVFHDDELNESHFLVLFEEDRSVIHDGNTKDGVDIDLC